MGGKKAFANRNRWLISGSHIQGFGVKPKVKPSNRVARESAFPEGPGHVLNSDEAFSTFRRTAKSTGSKAARAVAAMKRKSYARTRPLSNEDEDEPEDEPEESDQEEESEVDSEDLDKETTKERRAREKREERRNAKVVPKRTPPSVEASNAAKAASERAERQRKKRSETIVISDSDDEPHLVPAVVADDYGLDDEVAMQLPPALYKRYRARQTRLTAAISSSQHSPRRADAPSPDKKLSRRAALFRSSPSPTPFDAESSPPPSVKPKSQTSLSKPKPQPHKKKPSDPTLTTVRVGNKTFESRGYDVDALPDLDPAIDRLFKRRRNVGDEGDAESEEGDDESEGDEQEQRREARELRAQDALVKATKKRKKEYRESRGPGYSNPRRN